MLYFNDFVLLFFVKEINIIYLSNQSYEDDILNLVNDKL